MFQHCSVGDNFLEVDCGEEGFPFRLQLRFVAVRSVSTLVAYVEEKSKAITFHTAKKRVVKCFSAEDAQYSRSQIVTLTCPISGQLINVPGINSMKICKTRFYQEASAKNPLLCF